MVFLALALPSRSTILDYATSRLRAMIIVMIYPRARDLLVICSWSPGILLWLKREVSGEAPILGRVS